SSDVCSSDLQSLPTLTTRLAASATIGTNFHLTRQLGLPYWHCSNRTEKTAFLLRCFCRRKVAFAVLVADEVNFEPIAGSPPAKGATGSQPAKGVCAITAGVPGT